MTIGSRPGAIRGFTPRRPHSATSMQVVAFGGGHGLDANLRALRRVADGVTAVVTVADNGGSSGRIRTETPVLPPGDLRMALAALSEDSDWGAFWAETIQHRFVTDGPLHGHAVGNLLMLALWQMMGDPIAGLDQLGHLLGARGRVLPMALEPLDIEADVTGRDGQQRLIRGQAEVAVAEGHVDAVRLIPPDPVATPEALEAIRAADWLVLGPGSWYTSVLPHLLVPEIAEAIRTSRAQRCITMNLLAGHDETEGMSPRDLLDVLLEAAGETRFDAMIADPTHLDGLDALVDRAEQVGMHVLLRQVSVSSGTHVHDPVRLAAAYRDIFDQVYGDVADAGASAPQGI